MAFPAPQSVAAARTSDGSFTNAAGSSFKSRQTGGSFVSVGFDGAFGGGFGVQVGIVNDAAGNTDLFLNFNGNMGFGLFMGLSAGTVSPTGDNQFTTSDFAGNSSSYTAGASSPATLSTFAAATMPGGYSTRALDSSYWAIRGSEQLQIEGYRKAGLSGNSINGISPNNGNIKKYLEWGSKL